MEASPTLSDSCFALAYFTGKHRNFCCLLSLGNFFLCWWLDLLCFACVVTCTVVGWVTCVLIWLLVLMPPDVCSCLCVG
jgi:hypothetical protein